VDDDFAVLDAWRGGDRRAGDALLRRHFDALYRFFRNKVDHGVDDLIQRTFTACIAAKDGLRGDASFRTWLFTVARHELYHYYAKRQREAALFEPGSMSVEAMGTSPSSIVARKQEQRLLLRALRTLPLDMQVAVELFYWEQLTTAEIAEIVEVPQGTAKSRLRRAREELEARLRELADTPEIAESTLVAFDSWAASIRDLLAETPKR
jgi:RNA polymerase sigma-70 factor (ECF subfamily)